MVNVNANDNRIERKLRYCFYAAAGLFMEMSDVSLTRTFDAEMKATIVT